MPLATGQTLSHFEILGSLGAGGMGEVYRARDTRLEREVAIKVLPEELASGGEALARFEREAKTLAALNHPNVAQVFGFDRVDDTCFIAMELVEGEDLAERLKRGPLRLEQVVDVGCQIAAGLEAAHEAGVVHRDLKPANVRRTPAGDIKVLDFGLAKPVSTGRDRASASTATTQAGQLLGTPVYMAPEQARGAAIDKRVDVWAFGCVLYECLTGRRAFAGDSISEVLAAVLEREPDLSTLPSATPARLRALLERCLRKDPRRRLRDVGDARLELEELALAGTAAGSDEVRPEAGQRLLLYGVAGVLLLGAGAWAGGLFREQPPERPSWKSVRITASQFHDRGPSWSRGGDQIAFSRNAVGSNDLYVMNVSTRRASLLRNAPGDEGFPRWSPDGTQIATLSTDRPGTPVILLTPDSTGPDSGRPLIETWMHPFDVLSQWGAMGSRPWAEVGPPSLLVSQVDESGQTVILRVGRDNGEVEQLTHPPPGEQDLYASYSFGGEEIVFVRGNYADFSTWKLMLMPAAGGEAQVLLKDEQLKGYPSWHPDGRRIFYQTEIGLWVFDVPTGDATPLTTTGPDPTGLGGLSISAEGRIAYSTGWHDTTLIRRDLGSGQETRLTHYTGTNFNPRISTRGEIAYISDRHGDPEIWVIEENGGERRVTDSPGRDAFPDWSPDGERLVFASNRDGALNLFTSDRFGNDTSRLSNKPLSGKGGLRWSPQGDRVGFIVVEDDGQGLWDVKLDGTDERRLLGGVVDFDWYLDGERIVCSLEDGRGVKLVAVHLKTKEVVELWEGPHGEIDVAHDGTAVMIATGLGHVGMLRSVLALVPPENEDGLPEADGEPRDLVRPDGRYHTHHGVWAPDMQSIVYVHDVDRATIYELVEER